MLSRYYWSLLLLAFSSFHVAAIESPATFPNSAKTAILKEFSSASDVSEFAEDDLDGDKLRDIVAIVHYSAEQTKLESIVVLKQLKNGDYQLLATSAVFQPHMRRTENVSIRKGSIYLSASGSSYTEYNGETYQFRLSGGRFKLIGVETVRGEIGDDKSTSRVSANLINNKLKLSQGSGKNKRIADSNLRPKPPFFLEDFTLDGISLDYLH
jgi:hypothetical protein